MIFKTKFPTVISKNIHNLNKVWTSNQIIIYNQNNQHKDNNNNSKMKNKKLKKNNQLETNLKNAKKFASKNHKI
jgi:hypothetical protein